MRKTILNFAQVRLQRLAQVLIEDITFQLNEGEHLAIVGLAGSGKTSLLEAIAKKAHVRSGRLNHPLLDEIAELNREDDPLFSYYQLISMVPSRHSFRDLSNTSNLYYQQRFNSADSEAVETVGDHLKREQSKYKAGVWTLDRLEDRLNLSSFDQKHLIKLSNGETKRLLLASALIKNPKLLLLDNPLIGLDPDTRNSFNQFLQEVADSGITIVMVTSPNEVPEMMTHVATISNQRLQYLKASEFSPAKFSSYQEISLDDQLIKELVPAQVGAPYPVLVDIREATIQYDNTVLLNHVSWKINRGERWLLKGHNGAGKSTLISLINADNPQAFSQDITLFGRRKGTGESIFDIKQKIGFVSAELFQYFPVNLSCGKVIESGFYDTMGLFRASKKEKRKTAISWMQLIGIENYADSLFRNVPESIQRLCLLARAMVKSPPLLILDEPCQGLDNDQQRKFKVLIEAICRFSDISLIYVSHFHEEVPTCLTHVMELNNGRVITNQGL